jgi:micrococcal nuclease
VNDTKNSFNLEFDQDREDRYGRLLAYVHDDGEMFNETLLEEGYAQVYTVPPNDRYVDRFGEAQEEARVTGRGIWALPADQLSQLDDRGNGIGGGGCTQKAQPEAPPKQQPQPAPEPPPDLDAPDAPAPAAAGSALPLPGGDCPESAPIKGNRTSSSGDLIYHVRGGQFYEKTKAEECFANASEAEAAGYRASKR